MKTVAFHTLGCKVNTYESNAMLKIFNEAGYQEVDFKQVADVYVINTCTVTNTGDSKSRQMIRKAIRKNPKATICVVGCYSQTAPEEIEKIEGVGVVLGTQYRSDIVKYVDEHLETGEMVIKVDNVMNLRKFEDLNIDRFKNTRAFLKIQDGCNNFCTYCIVPYTRGRERSRTPEDIINEIKELAENGTKEITLLGQNVDSYGKTLENPITFAQLLRMTNEIEGLERIRFMTSHPKDISDEVIYAMRDCDKVCEFLHLPVQCGSTSLLRKMNRHYTKEDYLKIIEKAKSEIPEIAFSTDLMIGFPGETEDDLLDTIDIVEKVKYDNAFTFIYSKREGTPAAKMEDQIPEDVKHERFNRVLAKVNEILAGLNKEYVGKTVEVLIEGKSKTDDSKFTGRTRQNKLVNFTVKNPEENLVGKLMDVKISSATTFSLVGEEV